MIKGSIQEEDMTIINIYAPNIGAPQYVRQMLTNMKGEINSDTIIVGDRGWDGWMASLTQWTGVWAHSGR